MFCVKLQNLSIARTCDYRRNVKWSILLEEPVIPYYYHDPSMIGSMSEKPEERNRDSRKASESNIEQGAEPPIDKTSPTEPVRVGGAKEGKGTSTSL
jgi:hypothetical protein